MTPRLRSESILIKFRDRILERVEGMEKPERPGYFYMRAPVVMTIVALLFNIAMPIDLAWATKTDTMPSPIGKEESVRPGQVSFLAPGGRRKGPAREPAEL